MEYLEVHELAKLVYNNNYEIGKWNITKWFIDRYAMDNHYVLDGFAGLGNISEMYSHKVRHVTSVEKNKETHKELFKRFAKAVNVKTFNDDSLNYLTNHFKDWWDIIDLDPWSSANKHILEAISVIKSPGYLLVTSGEPYAISRFKCKMTRYGYPLISKWEDFPEELYRRYILPLGNKYEREIDLLNTYKSTRICRLVLEVR